MYWQFVRSIALALVVVLAGCVNTGPYSTEHDTSSTTRGAGSGVGTGAPPGVAIPSDKDSGKGTPSGAAAGTAIGGPLGSYHDRQEAELRQQLEDTGVRVQRTGDNIKLIMPGNIVFAVNSEQIQPSFAAALDKVAVIVRKFDKTVIEIRGYTDSTGSFEHNQGLSERRAQSVAGFLLSRQVAVSRVRASGYGPRYPIATNTTEIGRAQNRRIEIDLKPRL